MRCAVVYVSPAGRAHSQQRLDPRQLLPVEGLQEQVVQLHHAKALVRAARQHPRVEPATVRLDHLNALRLQRRQGSLPVLLVVHVVQKHDHRRAQRKSADLRRQRLQNVVLRVSMPHKPYHAGIHAEQVTVAGTKQLLRCWRGEDDALFFRTIYVLTRSLSHYSIDLLGWPEACRNPHPKTSTTLSPSCHSVQSPFRVILNLHNLLIRIQVDSSPNPAGRESLPEAASSVSSSHSSPFHLSRYSLCIRKE